MKPSNTMSSRNFYLFQVDLYDDDDDDEEPVPKRKRGRKPKPKPEPDFEVEEAKLDRGDRDK